MKVQMKSGRTVVNLFAEPEAAAIEATASDATLLATAAVNNTEDGICPKCSRSMGFALIPVGQVYYCAPCRVTTPMMEA